MTRLCHSILIDAPAGSVARLARNVEAHPSFLPGYIESLIIERQPDRALIQRRAITRGKTVSWKSWLRYGNDGSLYFEHAEGPLRGMQVQWHFAPVENSRTRLTIIHDVCVRRPWVVGYFLERFFFVPRLNEMAQAVVESMKRVCEEQTVATGAV